MLFAKACFDSLVKSSFKGQTGKPAQCGDATKTSLAHLAHYSRTAQSLDAKPGDINAYRMYFKKL